MFLVPAARGRGLGPDAARAVALYLQSERGLVESHRRPVSLQRGGEARWRRAASGTSRSTSRTPITPRGAPHASSRANRRRDRRQRRFGRSGSGTVTDRSRRCGRPRAGVPYPVLSMKVVLADNSELELPDGATGLDAARAIGPKLADEAVLVRSNGRVQICGCRWRTAGRSRSSLRGTRTTRTRSRFCGTPLRTCWPRRSAASTRA